MTAVTTATISTRSRLHDYGYCWIIPFLQVVWFYSLWCKHLTTCLTVIASTMGTKDQLPSDEYRWNGITLLQCMCSPMNFEWYMRIVSTSHFDWVAIPQTICKGVVESTVGLRTRCRLMNAVQVGDLSLIPCSQWVISKMFACFHSCKYHVGCQACTFMLYIL